MKPIIIKPGDGGALLADASGGNIGFKNYRIKRDWRRSIDVEMRAEGHVKFAPNLQHAETGQAYPPGVDGPITVISKATLPSGYFCVVTGTATTLWAYFGLSDPTYVLGDGNGLYVAAGYFDDQPGDWVQIYTGSAGER